METQQAEFLEITETDPVDGERISEVILTKYGKFMLKGKLLLYYKSGFYYPGWNQLDYMRWAIENYGWENYPIWGIKGSRKSNRLMWLLYQIYGDWNLVHKYLIMTPLEFAALFKEYLNKPDRNSRFPMVGWDDIAAWFDSQTYFENRGLYTRIKRSWTMMRTKLNVFVSTLPNKSELPGFILRDINSEMFCTPNSTSKYDRWTWRMNYKDPMKVIKRPVNIHDFKPFDQAEVPLHEFEKYHKRRMGMGDIAAEEMVSILEDAFNDAPNEEDVTEAKQKRSEAARELAKMRWSKR